MYINKKEKRKHDFTRKEYKKHRKKNNLNKKKNYKKLKLITFGPL